MSLLINQNWIGLDGTPVTGRVPPQIIMMAGVLTPQRHAQVAHAYQMFCMGKLTSVTDYFVADRTLTDGTRVRCESMQGKDRVFVWAADDEGEEVFPPHGIGVIFTDANDDPVEPFSRIKAGTESEKEPQPIILVPGAKKVGGKVVSDGKWRVRRASKLVGGQRLWVASDRKKWMSIFAWFVDIYANYETVGPGEPDPPPDMGIPDQRVWFPQLEWTPNTFGRLVPVAFSKRYGKYVMRSNEAFGLMQIASITPPFLAVLNDEESKPVPHIAHLIAQSGAIFFGKKPFKLKMGADPGAFANVALPNFDPTSEFTITPDGLAPIAAIPSFTPKAGSITVHPDGTRALVMVDPESTVGGKSDGSYAEIAIGRDVVTGTKKIDPQFRDPTAATISGGGSSTETLSITPFTAASSGELLGLPVTTTRGDGIEWTASESVDVNASYEKEAVSLVRAYFSLSGDEVFERVRTKESATESQGRSSERSGRSRGLGAETAISRPGPNPVLFFFFSPREQHTSEFSTRRTARTVTLDLGVRDLEVSETVGTISFDFEADSISSDGVTTTTNYLSLERQTVLSASRTVLHWDRETNFIVYAELRVTAEVTRTKADPDATIVEEVLNKSEFRLKAERGDTIVLDELIFEPPPPENVWGGLINFNYTGSGAYSDAGDAPLSLTTPEVVPGSGVNDVPLAVRAVPLVPAMTCWLGGARAVSTQAVGSTSISVPSAQLPANFVDPVRFLEARSARDPVTFASVVSLTFYGADYGSGCSYKNWVWAVDHTGVKKLKDLLKIPGGAELQISKQYSLNSLVSI